MPDYEAIARKVYSDVFHEGHSNLSYEPIEAALKTVAEEAREEMKVEFVSAVSGLRYTNRGSAGDVSAIIINGETFNLPNPDDMEEARDAVLAMDAEHEALLEFYRAMRAWQPWQETADERLNAACREVERVLGEDKQKGPTP